MLRQQCLESWYLRARQQISTQVVNTGYVLNDECHVVCGCDEQQCAQQLCHERLSRVTLAPQLYYRLTVTAKLDVLATLLLAPRCSSADHGVHLLPRMESRVTR